MEATSYGVVHQQLDVSLTRFVFGVSWGFERCKCGKVCIWFGPFAYTWSRYCADSVARNRKLRDIASRLTPR